jgi:hypothetical protein
MSKCHLDAIKSPLLDAHDFSPTCSICRLIWRELSRMVFPWTRALYFCSSSISDIMTAIPSLSVENVMNIRIVNIREWYTKLRASLCAILIRFVSIPSNVKAHSTDQHLCYVQIRVLCGNLVLISLDTFDVQTYQNVCRWWKCDYLYDSSRYRGHTKTLLRTSCKDWIKMKAKIVIGTHWCCHENTNNLF